MADSSTMLPTCDLCSNALNQVAATFHCTECAQQICDNCSEIHKRMRMSQRHRVVPISDMTSAIELRTLTENYCPQHPDKAITLYCKNCKITSCTACLVSNHSSDESIDVETAIKKLHEQLNEDISKITTCAEELTKTRNKLDMEKSIVVEKISRTKSKISERYESLLSLIESQHEQLKNELTAFEEKKLNEIQHDKEEIEKQIASIENLKQFGQELNDSGTASDTCRTLNDLHSKAEELGAFKVNPNGIDIIFATSLTSEHEKNLIGKLSFKVIDDDPQSSFDCDPYRSAGNTNDEKFHENSVVSSLLKNEFSTRFMPKFEANKGFTIFGNALYIVRGTPYIHIYNLDCFEVKPKVPKSFFIPESNCLHSIVACSHYNCLYVSDLRNGIFRYDLSSDITNKWPTSKRFYRLSVTSKFHLLAVVYEDISVIREYTTNSRLIREIKLNCSIKYSPQCIELSTGMYAVSDLLGKQHRLCIVDSRGRIVHSYCRENGSGHAQLSTPWGIAVDKSDNVIVADHDNSRLLALSPTLAHVSEITIPRHEVDQPYDLFIDEPNGRLYIAEVCGRLYELDTREGRGL